MAVRECIKWKGFLPVRTSVSCTKFRFLKRDKKRRKEGNNC